jgi:2-isopropylmalate synthase
MERIEILDTTLGAGEHFPSAFMTPSEKLRIAEALDQLGVDVIDLGWLGSTPEDVDVLRRLSEQLKRPVICAYARPTRDDVASTADALSSAQNSRLRLSFPSSDLQLRQLGISRQSCLESVSELVTFASSLVRSVELSAEDAARADPAFLARMTQAAIDAGATIINLADSVGYAVPEDFTRILRELRASVPDWGRATLSVRCYDDLGLAVANSLAAVQNGARQIECALNGSGPRAGYAALEEVVMALRVRPDLGAFETGIRAERLYPASQLVAHITGVRPPANKAIVGDHAFGHEWPTSNLPALAVNEILKPETVGVRERRLPLGRHSTRDALVRRLRELGYELESDHIEGAYEMFRMLVATKKTVLDEDLVAIYYQGTLDDAPKRFRLEHLNVVCGRRPSRATVRVREEDGVVHEASAEGDGPIDATVAALQQVLPWEVRLESFGVQAATPGTDALAEAHLHVRVSGHVFSGRAASTDIVDAAARAFLNAVDKAAHTRQLEARALERAEYWGV